MARSGNQPVSGLPRTTGGFWSVETHFRQVRRAERLRWTPLASWTLAVCSFKNAENN